jgi:gas vesicle protein
MNKTFLTLFIGIGIGILLAPAKGSETWKKLVAGIDEYKDKVSDEVSDLVNEGKNDLDKAKSRFQSDVNDFKGAPTLG